MIDRFAAPWLLLLLILPLLVLLLRPRRGGATFGPTALLAGLPRSRGPLLHRALLAAGLAALALAAARPQTDTGGRSTERTQHGRNLMLVIDLSLSMRHDDIVAPDGARSDRLAAVVRAAHAFISRRGDDRIGLTFFSDRAVTGCPLTYDHETVRQFLDRTEQQARAAWRRDDGLLGAGTNLGRGLAVAVNHVVNSTEQALGAAVVLITDGADTRESPGWVDPLEAARKAAAKGVRVHGIGVGDPQGSITRTDVFGRVVQVALPRGQLPDLERLRQITRLADGAAHAATDADGLAEVFRAIDALEPTPRTIRVQVIYAEHWRLLAAIGLALAACAVLAEPRLRGVA